MLGPPCDKLTLGVRGDNREGGDDRDDRLQGPVRGVASLGELIINSLDEGCASEIKFISNSKYATLSEERDVVRSRFGDSREKGTESLLEEGTESLFE